MSEKPYHKAPQRPIDAILSRKVPIRRLRIEAPELNPPDRINLDTNELRAERMKLGIEESYQQLKAVIEHSETRAAEARGKLTIIAGITDLHNEQGFEPEEGLVADLRSKVQELFDNPNSLGGHEFTREKNEMQVTKRLYLEEIDQLLKWEISDLDEIRLRQQKELLERGADPMKMPRPYAYKFSK